MSQDGKFLTKLRIRDVYWRWVPKESDEEPSLDHAKYYKDTELPCYVSIGNKSMMYDRDGFVDEAFDKTGILTPGLTLPGSMVRSPKPTPQPGSTMTSYSRIPSEAQ